MELESFRYRETVRFIILFSIFFAALYFSPVDHTALDARYTILLTETILERNTFQLDASFRKPLDPSRYIDIQGNGYPYQVEPVNGHIYYSYPPGTSLLLLPVVPWLNLFKMKSHWPDWTHDPKADKKMQLILAAMFMALWGCVFFRMSRIMLPLGWSIAAAFAAVFTTPVWSHTSRALWNECPGILLLLLTMEILVKLEMNPEKRLSRFQAVILATLCAWMYFVRPTYSLYIITITVFLLLRHRRNLWIYFATGAAWGMLFLIYSRSLFGAWLPPYYERGNILRLSHLFEHFYPVLFSPSRGLFVFMPQLLWILAVIFFYYKHIPHRPLVWISLSSIMLQVVLAMLWRTWWGTGYGPRLLSSVIPWVGLLGILCVAGLYHAWNVIPVSPGKKNAWIATGALILVLALFIHARGALSRATWEWNFVPRGVVHQPSRALTWRYPQFMAGLTKPPLPDRFPKLPQGGEIKMGDGIVADYLRYGWALSEGFQRWNDGTSAELIFDAENRMYRKLEITGRPYLGYGLLPIQRVRISLNRRFLDELLFEEDRDSTATLSIPKGILTERNILSFEFPDAASPRKIQGTDDVRILGFAFHTLEFRE
jgi:hypothetical protein